ncbi:MAG TPA: energy-coupling factor transporter transmembrane protein EcfT [Firmicutes bacterium]|nr:energy-coupling factor transporter transmembrane protein EcfT [Bacillota bacterium]
MFRDVAFGQYYPGDSFLHKMDARVKMVLSLVYLICIFFIQSFFGFGVIFVLLALIVAVSRVPVRSVLKSIKPILILLIFTTLLNLFFNLEGETLVQWWIFRITTGGLIFSAKMILRLVLLVMGMSMLTLTTTPVDLTAAIESLLKPLNVVHFPVHELAFIMSIALRLIPSIMEETDRIIRAQKARGADFESGNIFKRAKAFIPILIPMFIGAFKRAEELAVAMDARCYKGAKGRTKMKILKCGWRDAVGAVVLVLFFAAVITLNYLEPALSASLPWMFFGA